MGVLVCCLASFSSLGRSEHFCPLFFSAAYAVVCTFAAPIASVYLLFYVASTTTWQVDPLLVFPLKVVAVGPLLVVPVDLLVAIHLRDFLRSKALLAPLGSGECHNKAVLVVLLNKAPLGRGSFPLDSFLPNNTLLEDSHLRECPLKVNFNIPLQADTRSNTASFNPTLRQNGMMHETQNCMHSTCNIVLMGSSPQMKCSSALLDLVMTCLRKMP